MTRRSMSFVISSWFPVSSNRRRSGEFPGLAHSQFADRCSNQPSTSEAKPWLPSGQVGSAPMRGRVAIRQHRQRWLARFFLDFSSSEQRRFCPRTPPATSTDAASPCRSCTAVGRRVERERGRGRCRRVFPADSDARPPSGHGRRRDVSATP